MATFSTVAVGLCWVTTSAVLSTRGNSRFVAVFHDAMAHNLVRFSFSSLCGYVYFSLRHPSTGSSPFKGPGFWHRSKVLFLPSVLLFSANFANSVSLERTGISVTYVFKSLIPFLTVLLYWLGGQRFPWRIYACLVPICVGVLLATVTDLQLDILGAFFAFASTLAQTGLNITSKRAILQLKASGMEAFFVMSTTCVFLSVPMLCIWSLAGDSFISKVETVGVRPAFEVISQAGLSYFMEYSLNFAYVALCSPLAFSITDICRRVSTVLYGSLLTGTPLTLLNLTGVAMSLGGALLYSCMSLRLPPGASATVKRRPRPEENLEAGNQPDVVSKDAWVSEYVTNQKERKGSRETDSEASSDSMTVDPPDDREATAGRWRSRYSRKFFLPAEATCVSPQALCSWSVGPMVRQHTAPAPSSRQTSPSQPGGEVSGHGSPRGTRSGSFNRSRSE